MPWTEKHINVLRGSVEKQEVRKGEGFDLGDLAITFAAGWIIGILTAIWLFQKV